MERELLIQLIVQSAGIILATAVPLVVLIFTLGSNRKSQEKNSNIQNSLLTKENIDKEIDRTRNAVTAAYNQIEELLFIASTMKPRSSDIQKYIEKVERIYVLFRQSINGLRFNTGIYRNRKFCEGCTLCDIRLTGDLAKATNILQDVIIGIDREVSSAFSHLQEALDEVAASYDLIKLRSNIAEQDRNYDSLLKNLEDARNRTYHSESEVNKLDDEIASVTARRIENEIEFKKVDADLSTLMDKVGGLNAKGRDKINDIIIRSKPQLDNAIFEYFTYSESTQDNIPIMFYKTASLIINAKNLMIQAKNNILEFCKSS